MQIFNPVGFADWRVALASSFTAKGAVVSTLAVLLLDSPRS
jgi:Fe2+ transport system protein B